MEAIMAIIKTGGFQPQSPTTETARETGGFQAEARPIQKGFQPSGASAVDGRGFQPTASTPTTTTSGPSIPASGIQISTTGTGGSGSQNAQDK